jgi:hypothetical protein
VSLPAGERRRLLELEDGALVRECEVDLYKASGTGGQKRNKTSSAVRMRHKASGVISKAADSRSQSDNRRKALMRLRESLALDLRETLDADYQPSLAAADALKKGPYGKNSKTRIKAPYLLAVAEILDVFECEGAALSVAAKRLSVTTSCLGKLLCGDDRIARRTLEMRSQRGLKPLRG